MAGPDDRSLNRTLGLFIENTDSVTFRTTFYGLATYREHNARHLVWKVDPRSFAQSKGACVARKRV